MGNFCIGCIVLLRIELVLGNVVWMSLVECEFDIVLYGVIGFFGKLIVEYFVYSGLIVWIVLVGWLSEWLWGVWMMLGLNVVDWLLIFVDVF